MPSNQIEVLSTTPNDQTIKDNVILRALTGDPRRHKPLAEHPKPVATISAEKPPAAMYTLETRYASIPRKVLPTPVEPNILYHIEAERSFPRTPSSKPSTPIPIESEPTKHSEAQRSSSPVLYTILGKSSAPAIKNTTTRKSISQADVKLPILYSLIASPRLRVDIKEPMKDETQPTPAPAPTLYPVVGNPNTTPRTKEKPMKMTQPPPPTPVSKSTENDSATYSVVGKPNLPKKTVVNRKVPPLETQTTKSEQSPTLYTIISQPKSPRSDNVTGRSKRPIHSKNGFTVIPPIAKSNTTTKKKETDEKTAVPSKKNKRPTKEKEIRLVSEPSIPKSETVFFPFNDEERTTKPRKARTTLSETSFNRQHRTSYIIARYDPLFINKYRSPYAYYPRNLSSEQRGQLIILPPIKHHHSDNKLKARMSRHRAPVSRTSQSLERYPVRRRHKSRLWDYEYYAQTDVDEDDDDDENSERFFRQRHQRRRFRPRTPWVPVW